MLEAVNDDDGFSGPLRISQAELIHARPSSSNTNWSHSASLLQLTPPMVPSILQIQRMYDVIFVCVCSAVTVVVTFSPLFNSMMVYCSGLDIPSRQDEP